MKLKNVLSTIILFLFVLCIISCKEDVPSWFPKKEEEMKIREELKIPDVRFKHNLRGIGTINALIGKAYWENIKEGVLTHYQKSEVGDVPIIVFTNKGGRKMKNINVTSATVGGGPLKKGRKYTIELRKNVKGKIEYRLNEDSAIIEDIFE